MRRIIRRAVGMALISSALAIGALLSAPSAGAFDTRVWDAVARCEASGNWSINTGNGYYGGLQFSSSTWKAFGGQAYAAYAHRATKDQQIAIARRVLHAQGPGAWPTCSRVAGLTRTNGYADPNALPANSAPPPAPSGDLVVDGVFGQLTMKSMQNWVGASQTGSWNAETVRALQRKVGARVDGIRGRETTRKTQVVVGATPDGIWGTLTTKALQRHLNRYRSTLAV